ncbi:MAG: phosphoribosyltransferase, partial [Bauldia sp.]
MPFVNRSDAGKQLAGELLQYKAGQPVILALPRGGVPVAAEIAAALGAPLDLLLVRKIGAPMQPELAMGAVVDGANPVVVRNDDVVRLLGVSDKEFQAVCDAEMAEIERRRKRYFGNRQPIDVEDRVAIIVDDGIATGATIRAGLQATRHRKPQRLVLAAPVAPPDTLDALRG